MKLRNRSVKIISVGTTVVLPDETIEIDEKKASLPSIKALIGAGLFEVIEGAQKAPKKAVKAEPEEEVEEAEEEAENVVLEAPKKRGRKTAVKE
ncbi:MAG: hypothetical protein IJM76_05930 [Lachnospiraceae bacterium]|nr:hypothetical protein [Lachnospiraceae bacterium]